ncbi:RusA family crossover junction endodeoxyribonuclease [Cupriavidus basilensis]
MALAAEQAMEGRPPLAGPLYVEIDIVLAIPASWPKKRQALALAGRIGATKKPDASNILKAIEDGMNGVVFVDDSQIVDGRHGASDMARRQASPVEIVELPLEKA